ncbi:MAG: hypothetical protein ABFC63_08190 [Thermoguttaceae bacterium]
MQLITLAAALATAWATSAPAQEYIATDRPGPSLGMNLSGSIRAQQSAGTFRDAVQTWGLYRIAVSQAEAGGTQDAKRTLSQITQGPPLRPSEVTGVWFCCGRPMMFSTAAPQAAGGPGIARAANRGNYVPTTVPKGLPANYLAADPRHGPVIDFTDERDARGTRITARTYRDGHVVIETPRADGLTRGDARAAPARSGSGRSNS